MAKKIFIFQQRGWGKWIGTDLANRLNSDGYKLGALTFKKSTHERIINSGIKYQLLENYEEIIENPKKYLGSDNYTIKEICDDLKINNIWEIMQSERDHVKSFGKKFYYSFHQNHSDERINLYFKAIYKLSKKVIHDFKADAIFCPNFASVPHIVINILSKKYNIKNFALTDTGVDDYMSFTYCYYTTESAIHNFYKKINLFKLNKNQEKSIFEIKKLLSIKIKKKKSKIIKTRSLIKEIILLPYKIFKSIYNKDKLKNFGATLDSPGTFVTVRNLFYSRLYSYQNQKLEYDDLGKIKNFAYYSLQFQPEEAIDVQSVRFNNQFETIRQIAMSLPNDMTLVVKDHPFNYSFRNPNHLIKIKNTPNVKLINSTISAGLVLQKCKILISVTGSIFFEAAFLGIPGIYLGRNGLIKLLPSIYSNNNLFDLSLQIRDVLNKKINKSKNKKIFNNYLKATVLGRLPIKMKDMWEKGYINDKNLELFYKEIKKEIEK